MGLCNIRFYWTVTSTIWEVSQRDEWLVTRAWFHWITRNLKHLLVFRVDSLDVALVTHLALPSNHWKWNAWISTNSHYVSTQRAKHGRLKRPPRRTRTTTSSTRTKSTSLRWRWTRPTCWRRKTPTRNSSARRVHGGSRQIKGHKVSVSAIYLHHLGCLQHLRWCWWLTSTCPHGNCWKRRQMINFAIIQL